MGDILIKKVSPTGSTGGLTYHVKNLLELEISNDIPSFVYALPTQPDTASIGMKVEGNTSTISLSWTLVDESSTVVEELTGSSAVETADEQMVFLTGGSYLNSSTASNDDSFQPHSIESKYELHILPPTGSTAFFKRSGIISKLSISKSGESPVVYTVNIIFNVADMQATTSA
jgi:hypothetical protein